MKEATPAWSSPPSPFAGNDSFDPLCSPSCATHPSNGARSGAIERLHEKLKRRIKTQRLLPGAETAAMLFWALLASGQITMRRVDGWPTLDRSPSDLGLAA